MPNVSRLRGRFFSVLLSVVTAILLPWTGLGGEAVGMGLSTASPGETGPVAKADWTEHWAPTPALSQRQREDGAPGQMRAWMGRVAETPTLSQRRRKDGAPGLDRVAGENPHPSKGGLDGAPVWIEGPGFYPPTLSQRRRKDGAPGLDRVAGENPHPSKGGLDGAPKPGAVSLLARAFGIGMPQSGTKQKSVPAPALTQIVDTVYRADGTPAQGSVTITWQAFTTSGGQAVAAGSLLVQLDASGGFNASLAANTGSSPASYYKATYKLGDGTTTSEYWAVPATLSTTIGAIRSKLVPANQAAQFLTRDFADSNYLNLSSNQTVAGVKAFSASPAVPGPQNAVDAANKDYVDTHSGGGGEFEFSSSDWKWHAEYHCGDDCHSVRPANSKLSSDGPAELWDGGRRSAVDKLQHYARAKRNHVQGGELHGGRCGQGGVCSERRRQRAVSEYDDCELPVGNAGDVSRVCADGCEQQLLLVWNRQYAGLVPSDGLQGRDGAKHGIHRATGAEGGAAEGNVLHIVQRAVVEWILRRLHAQRRRAGRSGTVGDRGAAV
jgi:hypothetical protein